MNDSWCLGVTHFARWRGSKQGGQAPGEICLGQHEQQRAGDGLRRSTARSRVRGERKRHLAADPTTQERAEMSPGDTGISHNHGIL